MIVYWLLLAFPAFMAMVFPTVSNRHGVVPGQAAALGVFVVAYTLLSLLRLEVGADWFAYTAMYDQARTASIGEAFGITDPVFSFMLWLSAAAGTGIYPANALCSLILGYGVVRLAASLREPWLAVTSAVPYILIVVGFGYVRQAGAIGMILLAIVSLSRGANGRTVMYLVVAAGLHSSAMGVFPFFGLALANRNKLRTLLIVMVGSAVLYLLLSRQLAQFETVYLEIGYQSGGALVRIAMSVVASLLVLARWRSFEAGSRTRPLWLGIALANLALFALLGISESTTAIDRLSLHFAAIQILVFGNIRQLAGFSPGLAPILRLLVLGLVVAVQLVWLVYATHAENWVPYRSVLTYA